MIVRILDYCFIYSYRRDKITFSLNTFFISVDLFQEMIFFTQRSDGILFDGFNDLTYRILRRDYHVQMDVTLFYPYLYICPIRKTFSYLLKLYFQVTFYTRYQNLPTVACNPDNMVSLVFYTI